MFPTVIFERFYILRQHRSAKTAHQEPKKRLYLEFTQKATALQVVIDLTYKTITCFADACLKRYLTYCIAAFAKTFDFTVSQSASLTISAVLLSKSNRISPHSPSLSA